MAEFPALPFFTDAYLGDTMHLSLEEHGAYLKLLMLAWRSPGCDLPDDDRRIATMLGVTAAHWTRHLRPAIEPFWVIADGRWTQKRLKKVRKYLDSNSAKKRDAANVRWSGKPLNGHEPGNAPASALASAPEDAPAFSHTRAESKSKSKEESVNHDKPESHEALAAPCAPASPAVSEAAPEPLPDALSAVWKGLVAAGVPRSLIGRWCRDYGDGSVVEAYQSYRRAVAGGEKADARTYIIATLNRLVGTRGSDRSPMAIYQRTQARLDRADDGERDWNPKPINEARVLALLAEMDPEGRA